MLFFFVLLNLLKFKFELLSFEILEEDDNILKIFCFFIEFDLVNILDLKLFWFFLLDFLDFEENILSFLKLDIFLICFVFFLVLGEIVKLLLVDLFEFEE